VSANNIAGVPDGEYGLHRCERGCGKWLYPHMYHICNERGSVTVDGWGRIVLGYPDGDYSELVR